MFGSSVVNHPHGNFTKLSCNKKLDEDPCLTPWSFKFGTDSVFSKTVEIPCGKCVVMNPQQKILELRGGLVIIGKLVIPDGVSVHIKTTGILVHGEFVMESSKAIDGTPDIRIEFLESPENMNFRLPPGEGPEDICGGKYGSCGIGRKPFVVAGGIIDFRGLPSPSMPTWVPLYDVDNSMDGWPVPSSEYAHHHPPPHGCRDDGILISHDLSAGSHPAFTGSFGSFWEWTPIGLKVSHRTHTQHCPVIDLKQVRHCIQPGATLLLTAKLILRQNGRVDQTDCAKGVGENNCMSIYQARMSANAVGRTSSLWKENRSFGSMLGEETAIALELNFTSQQRDDTNVYEILQIRGPGPGVDMELLEFTLRYPPREAFAADSKSVCKDLVQSNGDAELLGLSPYPFVSNNQETHLSIMHEEGGNHYFAVTGREFAVQKAGRGSGWRSAGISWSPPPSCVKTHTKYTFEADVRMHSFRMVDSEWKLKGFLLNTRNPVVETIAVCPRSKGTWVKCFGTYEPSKEMTEAERFQVVLETDTSSFDVDYDVDNISFKPTEGALDRLILPKSIENLWKPGAEVLLNSHSSDWGGHSVRTIIAVENHDHEGYVNVRLNEAISQPLTLGSHPYHATEVALLSRNIVIDGTNGAHLSILHTPGYTQVIQGVDFSRFGQQGVRDAYPIHFDYCAESANSVISKNTIRHSNQRCIVLDATNDVLVEGNVAFDNKGHCFVVETGTERGNVFKSNLGSYTREVETLMPQAGASGKESDKTPATFWIGSPSNYWIDNVASGSSAHGFWFELRQSARGPHASDFDLRPSEMELIQFSGNIAHSTRKESLAITGYHPRTTAVIDAFKSFLTANGHFLVSTASNLAAHDTILDTALESNPFPMSGTRIVAVESENPGKPSLLEETELEDRGHATDPTVVFNLQPGAGISQ
ncbi:hypothetical protein IV203_037892 [Nitzschia inconspicua]|uniref:CEMIP beta-helix domain-containing protein n=1 Tax=Nitzschia inconspicua TaxID=303405 RepID=A0A9K3PZD4_9STRA|nr:hypothetical protein IV203_037892 [Nitzschia inconspicua]